jgi:membrane protein
MFNLLKKIKERILKLPLFIKLQTVSFPGLQSVPVLDVAQKFKNSLMSSRITMRAAAVSFDFFMALFPTIIFLFTLTAYLPIDNFDELLLDAMRDVLPPYTFLAIEQTIMDVISIQRDGLLSFGFLFALFYATNGITSLIESFNALSFTNETRPGWKIRLLALMLTMIIVGLLVIAITMMIFTNIALDYLIRESIISDGISSTLIQIGKWLFFYLLIFFTICFLYYVGPASGEKPSFFSPGAFVVSVLIMLLLLGFGFFVNNFSTWNTVYGSVGALIAVLVLINANALIILAGHEFNAVVFHLKRQRSASLVNESKI